MQALSKTRFAFAQGRPGTAPWFSLGCCLTLFLTLFSTSVIAASPDTNTNEQQIAAVKAQMNAAILRVRQIVNQPVTELRRRPGMQVGRYSPGWFHPGAAIPDFLTVDVRKTQEFPYSKFQYVTSDLNPGVVFLASELEFNPNTKYFYTDRSVPKRRLTEAEMLEINQLYRVIGHCEHRLFNLERPIDRESLKESQRSDGTPQPQPMLAVIHRWVFMHKPAALGIIAGLLVTLILLRTLRKGFRDDF